MSQMFIDKGKLRKPKPNEKQDYTFISSSDFFSPTTNLVQGLSGVSQSRTQIGDKASLQQISLVTREQPLQISTDDKTKEVFIKDLAKHGQAIFQDKQGTVKKVSNSEIVVDDQVYKIYDNFPTGKKGFTHHEPKVKVGDKVQKGAVLQTGNFTDEYGNLALGKNLKQQVMPFRSLNFEDQYQLTEQGQEKLIQDQLFTIRFDKIGVEVGKNKFISYFPGKYNLSFLQPIDSEGVVKKGTKLEYGTPLVLQVRPKSLKSLDIQLGRLSKVLKSQYSDQSEYWGHESPGEVIDVQKGNDTITVTVKTRRGVQSGDKISVSQGQKGVVSIIPNSEQPMGEDGKPVDVILNTMSITSRIQPGLLSQMQVGKVQQKTGKSIEFPSFAPGHQAMWQKQLMEKHGVKDKEKLYDPVTGNTMDVFTGPLYVNRMVHIACFDKDTEVWTDKGWKYWEEVVKEDKLATLNGESLAFEKPLELHKGIYKGLLLGYKSKFVDYLVTPNHRLFINRPYKKDWEYLTQDRLHNKRFNVLQGGWTSLSGSLDFVKRQVGGVRNKEQFYKEDYNDYVYCATMRTGLLIVRRNGKVMVSGNSDKVSQRNEGLGYTMSNQPQKGTEESAKRIGNLSTQSILSNNMSNFLEDVGVVRGTNYPEWWRQYKLGQPLPQPKVPFVFEQFVSNLKGQGVNVKERGDEFDIMPLTNSAIKDMSKGVISEPLTYRVKNSELVQEKKGLFDQDAVGLMGDQWNHIDLNFKIPNPISEDYLRKLVGMTKQEYEKAISDGTLQKKLEALDVDTEFKKNQSILKSGRGTKRDTALKNMQFLRMMQDNKMKPSDLLLDKVPVLPQKFRPVVWADGKQMGSSVNELYKDLMLVNRGLEGDTSEVPEQALLDQRKKIYQGAKQVFGLQKPINRKSVEKNYKGLLQTTLGLQGGSQKSQFFQANVVNKPVDSVGRQVLVPETKLSVDEVGLPQDIQWKVYTPYIIRRLVTQGLPQMMQKQYVEKRNPVQLGQLKQEMAHRPGLVTRDPQLHKFSQLAMYPVLNQDDKDKTLKLNPLVFKGFGQDSDGDQMNFQLPQSEEQRQELIEKQLPSKNLFSHRTFQPMLTPSNEAQLGLFLQTSEPGESKDVKSFKTKKEFLEAWNRGDVKFTDNVNIAEE